MNGNNMFNNWNNRNNPYNMNMNGFINANMGMNLMNNLVEAKVNMMMQNFYNQMLQIQVMNLNKQMNMMKYIVNNNAKAINRLPTNHGNVTVDPFADHPGQRTNIIFQTAKGFKISISAPLDVTVNQVLIEYIKRVGLGPNALYNGFYFLFNGAKIDIYDKVKVVEELVTLKEIKDIKLNHITILVIDTKNLIGS